MLADGVSWWLEGEKSGFDANGGHLKIMGVRQEGKANC
jgi:hypothetical protein